MRQLQRWVVALTMARFARGESLLLLQNGFTKPGCKGSAIPVTLGNLKVCGAVSAGFSAVFSANASDVHVDVYNASTCGGHIYETRDVGIGECVAGALEYSLVHAAPAGACVLWGFGTAGCAAGTALSGNVARKNAKCQPAQRIVDQTSAIDAGGGRFNISVAQYDPQADECDVMSRLDLLTPGACVAMAPGTWYSAYVQLECGS